MERICCEGQNFSEVVAPQEEEEEVSNFTDGNFSVFRKKCLH
jgi:hypothetical protein